MLGMYIKCAAVDIVNIYGIIAGEGSNGPVLFSTAPCPLG